MDIVSAAASTSLQNKPWPVQVPVSLVSHAERTTPTITMCKLENSNLATQVLEQQLANQLLERYSQLAPISTPICSASFTPFSTKLLAPNIPTTIANSLLSSQLSNQLVNSPLLSNQLVSNPLLSNHLLSPNTPIHPTQPLILPRYNNLSVSPRSRLKDEGNSRRLRWKEEHGRALISIWKENYPKVRAAKKIKEKHAVWQDIGDSYNKLCIRFDWPPRSTDQVKIKVKNCIDEYKQTIKYNQEYKTCPYFKDIDDIFGMSDPEKSAELQNTVAPPIPDYNTDNIYWSGTSLPTQVKKRKLNIRCKPSSESEECREPVRKSPMRATHTSNGSPPSCSPNQVSSSSQQDMYLLNLPITQTTSPTLKTVDVACKPEQSETRYEVKIGKTPVQTAPVELPTQFNQDIRSSQEDNIISISQFTGLLKQMHDRELRMVEMYHQMDLERRNSYIQRERERHDAEYQLEESRQKFLGGLVEKLIEAIKDKHTIDKNSTLPTLNNVGIRPSSQETTSCEGFND